MTQVFKLTKLDVSTVSLKRVEKNERVYYNILDEKNNFLYIQTDYLYNTFPISDYKGNKKYGLQLNIDEKQYEQFNQLKQHLLKITFENKEILKDTKKKIKSEDALESLFNFPVSEREYQDKKYYTLKTSFNGTYENVELLKCDVLLNKEKLNDNVYSHELIKMLGTRNKALYVLKPYFYIVGGNIGCSFKVELIKLKQDAREKSVEVDFKKLVIDIDDDEDSEEENSSEDE